MNWLAIGVIYYILIYLGFGGLLVDVFGLTTWDTMIGLVVGCWIGHYLGKSDRVRPNWVRAGSHNVHATGGWSERSTTRTTRSSIVPEVHRRPPGGGDRR